MKTEKPNFYKEVSYCTQVCAECEHFKYQNDNLGFVAITFCEHPANKSKTEGNANKKDCPL